MKETTIINQISNLIDKLDYKIRKTKAKANRI